MARLKLTIEPDPLDLDILRRMNETKGEMIPYAEAKGEGYLGSYYAELGKRAEDSTISFRVKRLVREGYLNRKVKRGSLAITEKGDAVLRSTLSFDNCTGKSVVKIHPNGTCEVLVTSKEETTMEIDGTAHHLKGIDRLEIREEQKLTFNAGGSASIQIIGGTFTIPEAESEKRIVEDWIRGTYRPQPAMAHRYD